MPKKLGPGEIDMATDQDINPAVTDLSTVPDLIKRVVNVGSILQAENLGQSGDTAMEGYHTVAEANPGKITVYRPNEYTPYVRNHEMTHELQQTRDIGGLKLPGNNTIDLPGQVKPYSPDRYRPGDPRNYSYGGQDALLAARGKKTIANFNPEQQADIVADYEKAQDDLLAKVQSGKYTQEDLKNWQATYDAYHPFVEQLSKVPEYSAKRSIGTLLGMGMPEAPPAPAAPGLPPADTPGLGYIQPDPVMGGVAAALTRPGTTPYMTEKNPKGMVAPGNLPIWNRPTVQNADGSHSSEYSTSFQDDKGHEILVPTVVNGKFLTPDGKKPKEGSAEEKAMFKAAWQHYKKTGENLGKFDNPNDATAYAGKLHKRG